MKVRLLYIFLLCSLPLWAVTFSPEAKRNCQQMDREAGTVTLIFATDQDHFAVCPDSLLGVWVSGSINDLGDTGDGYQLDQWSEDSCYYHTFRCEELLKPGNSGQPEFVFYLLRTDSTDANYYAYDQKVAKIDEWLLCYNGIPYTMIMMPCGPDYFTTDTAELLARCNEAKPILPLADFDLTNPIDQQKISNFRLVPGTTQLYRSYHPYYPSNAKYDTEERRLYWVAELGRQAGVRSDISLTGNLEHTAGRRYRCGADSFEIEIPDYQQALIDSGDILYVGQRIGRNPSVVECYYHSEDTILSLYLKEIVEFIADTTHPMPVQVHCAIGADRTGLVCAVIAALCGADWQAILTDYQRTGEMKIQTYRHPNRLRYALSRMTGVDPDRCTAAQLDAAIREHLVRRMQVLTDAQIDRMVARLKNPVPSGLETVIRSQGTAACYDMLGRPMPLRSGEIGIQPGTKKYLLR